MKSTVQPLLGAIAHLLVLFFFGLAVIVTALVLMSTGVGLLIVFGIGLIPLGLSAFLLAGIARLEEERVAGLFGLDIPAHRMVRSERTDWRRLPHTAWLQAKDRRNWTGALHFTIMFALATGVMSLFLVCLSAIPTMVAAIRFPDADLWLGWFGPISGGFAVFVSIIAIVVSIALMFGLALAHRTISTAMMVPSREELLVEQATVATHRRQEAMNAADIERTRIERDLHDGVQPRLVSVGMTLGMAMNKLDSDPAAAAALISEAHTSTKAAITELRQLARGIHPAVLDDRGLDAALSALAARSHVPVHLDVRLARRLTKEIETALYFTIAETLTNAAKHSNAQAVRVTVLEREGQRIWARIEDDGRGGAVRTPGGGLDGIAGRIAAVGGTLTVTSPAGGPTTIEVSVPCAS